VAEQCKEGLLRHFYELPISGLISLSVLNFEKTGSYLLVYLLMLKTLMKNLLD